MASRLDVDESSRPVGRGPVLERLGDRRSPRAPSRASHRTSVRQVRAAVRPLPARPPAPRRPPRPYPARRAHPARYTARTRSPRPGRAAGALGGGEGVFTASAAARGRSPVRSSRPVAPANPRPLAWRRGPYPLVGVEARPGASTALDDEGRHRADAVAVRLLTLGEHEAASSSDERRSPAGMVEAGASAAGRPALVVGDLAPSVK